MKDGIEQWVVYNKPLDYPEHAVIRRVLIYSRGIVIPDDNIKKFKDIDEAMEYGKKHFDFFLERHPDDVKSIHGVWI